MVIVIFLKNCVANSPTMSLSGVNLCVKNVKVTARERRALLRRRPNVTSWRHLLQTAQDEYERQRILTGTERAS